jgi:ABC-type Na+ efflux pump permease subunit
MKKIKAALIIMAWMMLMLFLLPVTLAGGISAIIGERINKEFRRYLDNVFGGLE